MPTNPSNPVAPQFPDPASLTVHLFPWIETPAGRFLGKGRVELLEKIIEHGSISKAAKEMALLTAFLDRLEPSVATRIFWYMVISSRG